LAVGKEQLAKSSWQRAVGKEQLANSCWQVAVDKKVIILSPIVGIQVM
jgi:hypothetical protein